MSYLNIIQKARNVYGIPSGNRDNSVLAATALKNLEDYGYTFGEEGYRLLASASAEDITDWYYKMTDQLQKLSGGNHTYRPFYPNFPEQVMELSELERFIEQISHYMFGYMPEGENKKEGIKSLEASKLKVLGVIDINDKKAIKSMASEVFRNTLASKQNINESTYRDIIREYMKSDTLWMKETGTVTNRNTLCMLYFDALTQKKNTKSLPNMVTKDYLRLAKIFSMSRDKDNKNIIITDPEVYDNQRIGSLPNNVRTFIIKGLNSQLNLEEDVARDISGFKALFKYLHVGAKEYSKYSDVQGVAYKIRNNQPLETYYSKMERYFKYLNNARENSDYSSFSKAYEKVLNHLGKRPGEFIKRIDRIISEGKFFDSPVMGPVIQKKELENLLNKVEECFRNTRPEDLINFIEFMNSRTNPYRLPIHNIRGNLILDNEKKYVPYDKDFVQKFTDIAKREIAEQLYSGMSYGKVYIDPAMDKMTLPKDKTSDNDISTYPKGSRLPIEKAADGSSKNLRFFVWWTNNHTYDAIDLDLSAKLYTMSGNEKSVIDFKGIKYVENNQYMIQEGDVSYHSSYNRAGCTHSGDITNGGSPDGKGVCEYIDLNLDELKSCGIKYVQMYINIYSGEPGGFKALKNCEFGYQERKELDKSEQFNIKAVRQHGKLDSTAHATTPCIIDVDKAEVIWVDVPDKGARNFSNSLSATPIDVIMDKYANEYRLSMGELARLAVTANGGEFVDSPEKADVVFMVDNYENATKEQRVITSKDADVWLGEFMSPAKKDSYSEKEELIQTREKQQDVSKSDVDMDKLHKIQKSFNALQEELNDFIETHNLQTDIPQDESDYEDEEPDEETDEEIEL